jgi:hypothetical protein
VDLVEATDGLNTSLAPLMVEFKGVESSFFAFKRLQYIEKGSILQNSISSDELNFRINFQPSNFGQISTGNN